MYEFTQAAEIPVAHSRHFYTVVNVHVHNRTNILTPTLLNPAKSDDFAGIPQPHPSSWTNVISSDEKTLSMSSIMMNLPSCLPMPLIKSVLSFVPILGACSICPGSSSITSWTESASAPSTVVSPSVVTSTTTMQVLTVLSVFDIPNFKRMSTTGTTLPRR